MHELYSSTALSTLANLGSSEPDREVLRNALSELIASGVWRVVRRLDDVHDGAPLLVEGERRRPDTWPLWRVDDVVRATPGSCPCRHRRVDVVAGSLAAQPTVNRHNELVTRTHWLLQDGALAEGDGYGYGAPWYRCTRKGGQCVDEAVSAGRIRRDELSIRAFRPVLEPLVKEASAVLADVIDGWLAEWFGPDYHEAFGTGFDHEATFAGAAGGPYAGWSDGGDWGDGGGGDGGGGGGE